VLFRSFLKTQIAAQGEFYRNMMEMAKIQSDKADKITDKVLAKQLGQGDEKLQNWKEGMEFLMRMQENMQGGGDDYDPEAGFMGNIGGLIFSGLKSLFKGGGGGFGQALAQAAAGHPESAPVEASPVFGANRVFGAPNPVSVLPSGRPNPVSVLPSGRNDSGRGEDFVVNAPPSVRVVPFPGDVPPVSALSGAASPVYADVYRPEEGLSSNGGKTVLDEVLNSAFLEMKAKGSVFQWTGRARELPEAVIRGVTAAQSPDDALKAVFEACDPTIYRKFSEVLKSPERDFALEYLRGSVKKLREVLVSSRGI